MSIWMALLICLGNVCTSIAGMAALKHAVATNNVVLALGGLGCWVWTAMFIVLLLANQPIIWIALMSSCLSIIGSISLGTFVFGEPLSLSQAVGLGLILAALVVTATGT